jgi:hypothetical protein
MVRITPLLVDYLLLGISTDLLYLFSHQRW